MSEAQGRVGRWLRNKWHLDSLIAIGGMAAVYSSTHRNGARAAIKLLHSQYTRNEQARRRFLAEGYAANKVGHRNAVLVLDDDTTEDGEVYLVMELLDGESLEGRLERVGVLSPTEVLELTDQLLDVLSYAHPKGILHRDIKPANIYLTRDGAVKLLDFGLARVRELSAEAMDQSDGIVFGTVSYIAPEQARADNQNLDARSDLWSIAATMFRCLSGETVHPSTGPIIDRLLAVARKPPRSIASVCPRLPRPVIELIDRALAFDPEARWPSANVMRVVVQDVLAQLTEEAEAAAEAAGTNHEPELELRTSVVFTQRNAAPNSRAKTGPDLPRVRPTGPQPSPQTPPPPPPQAPPQTNPPTRPRTDPQVISSRPASLPLPVAAAPNDDEVDLDVDALRERPEETRQRRSRTLLTKEGRAELRRILDARKAGVGLGEAREETPTFSANAPVASVAPVTPQAATPPAASDSFVGDVDLDFDDSLIEVTIDHTRHGRSGPLAEPLADPVTPAPVSLPRPVPEDRPGRQTGGYPTLGARSEPTPGRVTTGSHPLVGAPPVTAGRAPITPREAVPEDSTRARASGLEDSTRRRPATGGLDDSARRRAVAMASLDDTARRRAATAGTTQGATAGTTQGATAGATAGAVPSTTSPTPAVPEDRHSRTTASYPTLGGASSRPFDVSTTSVRPAGALDSPGPRPVSGEIDSGPAPVTGEVPRPAPVVISGEIVSGPTRSAEITRVGAAPTSVEVHVQANRPAEITRVGPAPAPQVTVRPAAEAPRAASITTGLNDTIRPKTIPPVSSTSNRSRSDPAGEPSAPRPVAREVTSPEPAAEAAKKAPLGRAGVFAAPGGKPITGTTEPAAQRGAVASDAGKPVSSEPARPGAPRPPSEPPRATGETAKPVGAGTASAGTPGAPGSPVAPSRATGEAVKAAGSSPRSTSLGTGLPQRPASDPPRPASTDLPQRPASDPPRPVSTDPAAIPRPAGAGTPAPQMSAPRGGASEAQRPASLPPRASPGERSAPRPAASPVSPGERSAPRPAASPVSPVGTSRPAVVPTPAEPARPAAVPAPAEPTVASPAPTGIGRTTLPATKSMFNPYPTRTPVPAPDPKDSEADENGRFAPGKSGKPADPPAASKTAASSAVGMPGPRPSAGPATTAPAPTQPVAKDSPGAAARAPVQPVTKDSPGAAARAPVQPVAKDSPGAAARAPVQSVAKDSPGVAARVPVQPVAKDSPGAAARASAPPTAQPVVDAAIAAEPEPPRPSTEPRARAGAPVLPFSFLRPGAAPARPAAAAEEPPKDGEPPRKKS